MDGKYKDALKLLHAREFGNTGKPMKGWIIVSNAGHRGVQRGFNFAQTLPAKK